MLHAKVDGLGKPGWIAVTLLALWAAWPLGLLVLGYLAWSGRLRTWQTELPGQWSNLRSSIPGAGWQGWTRSSGNQTFDDYRAETLQRLEDEQREFQVYLERLRRARDKAEFDQFMAERRTRGTSPVAAEPDAGPNAA